MSSISSQIHGSTTSFTYSCPNCPRSYQGSTLAHIPRVCHCNRIVDSQRIVTNGNGKLPALAYSDSALGLISVGNGAASQPTSASQLDRQSILEPEPSQNRFANPRLGPPQAPPQVRNQLQVASGNSTENPPSYHNDTRPPSYRSPPPSFHSTDPLDPVYRQSSNSRAPSQHSGRSGRSGNSGGSGNHANRWWVPKYHLFLLFAFSRVVCTHAFEFLTFP